MSLYKNIYRFLIKATPFSSKFSENYDYYNDPYGLLEAEEWGNISDRIIKCSHDKKCPEYAQALFWIAADIFSELDILDDDSPNYDLDDPEFKRGLNLMEKAHNAGSIYATNELGLLYLEQSQMRDLKLAEKYFEKAFNNGDPVSAYNLARTIHHKNSSNQKAVLEYLKFAAEYGHKDYEISYFLTLHALGEHEEQLNAAKYIRKNKKTCRVLLNRVSRHFNLNLSNLWPPAPKRRLFNALHSRF